MLHRYDDGINTKRDHGTTLVLVLNGDLRLGVRSDPGKLSGTTSKSHCCIELVGKDNRQRHVLLRLIGSIAEHDTLVTSTMIFQRTVVKTLGDIGRLLLDGNENVARFVIKAFLRVIIADFLDGVSDDFLVVQLGLGGDLTKDHDHTSLCGGLASDL